LFALALGLAGGVIVAFLLPWPAAALLPGWDGAATLFATRVWVTVLPMSPTQCSDHATNEDPSRAVADSVVLVAASPELRPLVSVAKREGVAATGRFIRSQGISNRARIFLTCETQLRASSGKSLRSDSPGERCRLWRTAPDALCQCQGPHQFRSDSWPPRGV
jgi:hypothetical protein